MHFPNLSQYLRIEWSPLMLPSHLDGLRLHRRLDIKEVWSGPLAEVEASKRFNSSPPSAAYMCQWIRSVLV